MTSILVVDDSPTIRTTVEWLLSNSGYNVRIAHDGLSALNALREFDPDLVLLDIRLPHVDGYQLCKLIRRNPRYAMVPIVMLSGLSSRSHIQCALDAGADDYVVKPIQDEVLLNTIQQQLSRAAQNPTH